LYDFCRKVDLRRVNRRVVEGLINCGAFDSCGVPRAAMSAVIDKAMEGGAAAAREREAGQVSMFEMMGGQAAEAAYGEYPDTREWSEAELLAREKEAIGFYITGHPLARFEREVRRYAKNTTAELAELPDGRELTLVGIVGQVNVKTTKKGDRMAYLTVEDLQGTVEVIVFPELYRAAQGLLGEDAPILVSGTLDRAEQAVRIKATKVESLHEVRERMTTKVEIRITATGASPEDLARLRDVLVRHRGACPVYLNITIPRLGGAKLSIRADREHSVAPTDELVHEVETLLGSGAVSFA
jgi:DNA polymerase-3 subunit alpha